tara:strand:- start:376 stop:960 length:585 start_codon:yes stop_codon:yes gene_type:complete
MSSFASQNRFAALFQSEDNTSIKRPNASQAPKKKVRFSVPPKKMSVPDDGFVLPKAHIRNQRRRVVYQANMERKERHNMYKQRKAQREAETKRRLMEAEKKKAELEFQRKEELQREKIELQREKLEGEKNREKLKNTCWGKPLVVRDNDTIKHSVANEENQITFADLLTPNSLSVDPETDMVSNISWADLAEFE